MSKSKLVALFLVVILAGAAGVAGTVAVIASKLPQMITIADYKPREVAEVYDRKGQKIGEFFNEKRIVIPYEEIPKNAIHAFISAEDSSFFEHDGLNYVAILRAALANLKAGRKVQGGSTITQQVARSLLLSSEKTYIRKIKEALLAYRMEANLSKEEILFLYLNQIYLGQGAYGIEAASRVYFRKPAKDLSVPEAALLAGLPQAPSRYSPTSNPLRAKERQRYVIGRMAEEGYISNEEAEKYVAEPVTVYVWKNYKEIAPYYLEIIRQTLVSKLGEEQVLDRGIQIYSAADMELQEAAQKEVQDGLREVDKRQGYRGPLENLDSTEKVAEFLLKTRNELMDDASPERVLLPDGSFTDKGPLNLAEKDENGQPRPTIPSYIKLNQIVKGVVTKVDDALGLTHVRFAESRGLIDIESMSWARKPDPQVRFDYSPIKRPSEALKVGDVIWVKPTGRSFWTQRVQEYLNSWRKKNKGEKFPPDFPEIKEFAQLELEQEPIAEAALVSIDQNSSELVAMVGGYDYSRSQFNRALQALRQTGSSFKSLVYAAALDKGYTPATPLLDVPLVYEESEKRGEQDEGQDAADLATKKWRPSNHSKSYSGEVLFRNALIRSLNIPTVKLAEDLGVEWIAAYARRLGIFSPLNMDFTIALGSSGVTVYEMTKAFSALGRMGRKVSPILIHKVVSRSGETLLEKVHLDERFEREIEASLAELESKYGSNTEDEAGAEEMAKNASEGESGDPAQQPKPKKAKKPQIFFKDPDQLIRPETAYVITSILQGAVDEPGGTGGGARSLGRPVAGKTGSTSGYYDAWFIGYTPDIATSVWVGFDQEKSLGKGEVGGRAALPIWLNYMKAAHDDLPARSFSVPQGIVFANIDNDTGKLASPSSKHIVRQAFIEGTEPQTGEEAEAESAREEDHQFYKEDLSE